MILGFILQAIVSSLNLIFGFLGSVTELPFGMDDVAITVFGYWYAFLDIFWPLSMVWTLTLWYLGIALTLWGLRLLRIIR